MGENGILIGMESKTLEACCPAQLTGHVEPLGFRIALKVQPHCTNTSSTWNRHMECSQWRAWLVGVFSAHTH